MDSFIAGLLGGYYVFGTSKSSVNQQIVIYVFARVILALAKLSIQPPGDNALVGSRYGGRGGMGVIKLSDETREAIRRNAWPVFASVSWAGVMWLFRWYPEMLQPSLKSSMTYMYVGSFSFVICAGHVLLFPFLQLHTLEKNPTDFNLFLDIDTTIRKNGIPSGISSGTTNSILRLKNSCIKACCIFLCTLPLPFTHPVPKDS